MTDPQSLTQSAGRASQMIFKILVDKRVQRMRQGLNPDKSPTGEPSNLAHYTTVDGLYGIAQNGNLWASSAYYLNDSSEIDYGCQLFTEILAGAIAEKGLDPIHKRIFEDAKGLRINNIVKSSTLAAMR